jgi:hypothetical protein
MVTPPGDAYATRRSRTCLVSSSACAGLSRSDLSGAGEGALVLEHVVYVAADEHRLVRRRELDAAEPAPLSNAAEYMSNSRYPYITAGQELCLAALRTAMASLDRPAIPPLVARRGLVSFATCSRGRQEVGKP